MTLPNTSDSVYFKHGFGLKSEIRPTLERDYHSGLVARIKESGNRLVVGELTVLLAQEFGFCYGVDKAVDYAYETRMKFPDKTIYLTSEIIHNPSVNQRLEEMGIRFLPSGEKRFDGLTPEDVVLIPAFGVTVEEMETLQKKGCVLVDTTCGSVVHVWKRVEKYAQDGFTAIIHGKYRHEETQATSSRVTQYPGGNYLIVFDLQEAKEVCRYVVAGGNKKAFLSQFGKVASPGFDPDRDLVRVGCANQTTMLSSESLEVAGLFREAMIQRYGEAALEEHFRSFDTICSATQERQDAVLSMVKEGLDAMVIVGGYNSSNTTHLCEIASQHTRAYHIEDAGCLLSKQKIRHKPVGEKRLIETEPWIRDDSVKIGVTAGASTPDRVTGEVIEKLARCWGHSLQEV